MHEHDAHRLALLIVGGCRDERAIESNRKAQSRRSPDKGQDCVGDPEEAGGIGE